jgi:hypothetical protein
LTFDQFTEVLTGKLFAEHSRVQQRTRILDFLPLAQRFVCLSTQTMAPKNLASSAQKEEPEKSELCE